MEKYQIPRGYLKESGISEYGMIFYNSLNSNKDEDYYKYHSDLFAMILPNEEHLELVIENNKFVVRWYKNKWANLYEKEEYATLAEACIGLLIMHNRVILEYHANNQNNTSSL